MTKQSSFETPLGQNRKFNPNSILTHSSQMYDKEKECHTGYVADTRSFDIGGLVGTDCRGDMLISSSYNQPSFSNPLDTFSNIQNIKEKASPTIIMEQIGIGSGSGGSISGIGGDDDDDDTDNEELPNRYEKRTGRRKIKIEYIDDKSRRHITFSKRKAGIMKKAYELSTLTGTQVLLLVASETGHVYTFATPKLQPLITKQEGKNLIQTCLNSPESSPLQQSMLQRQTNSPNYNDLPERSDLLEASTQHQKIPLYPFNQDVYESPLNVLSNNFPNFPQPINHQENGNNNNQIDNAKNLDASSYQISSNPSTSSRYMSPAFWAAAAAAESSVNYSATSRQFNSSLLQQQNQSSQQSKQQPSPQHGSLQQPHSSVLTTANSNNLEDHHADSDSNFLYFRGNIEDQLNLNMKSSFMESSTSNTP